ncbi:MULTISPECIES: ZIP family metal transporter [Methylomonas]|uniref:Zinc permease n=1 Tax=Methylomonas koyamae TaxID=702114 RepID=A0A177NNV6_9GAMM|nr:ZIP family metal transporter [Methylomonas koyamae]OAI19552.1 zinc permease [Methylomonas koyamae]
MNTYLATIAASLAVSLCSLSSAFALWLPAASLKRIVPFLVALAVGVLLGDAFIHLIPDAVARQGSVSTVCMTALIGVFGFFVLEKLVRWRHDHNVDTRPAGSEILPLAKMNLIGDAIHNFVDGILIAGSFLADPALGLTTTLAIVAHEVPQELGDVGALLRGGYAPRQAVLYNFYCSLSVVPGALFTLLLSQVAASSLVVLLPIAAGGFIYIAASDLIPVLHERSTLRHLGGQSASFALGIALMQGIVVFEQSLLAH